MMAFARTEPWYGVSLILNLAAFICVSVELSWARQFYAATCTTLYSFSSDSPGTKSTTEQCWPFFLVAWELALPSAVIAFFASGILMLLHHKASPSAKQASAWTSVAVTVLWMVTVLFGWIGPLLANDGNLPSVGGLGDTGNGSTGFLANGDRAQPPVSGAFRWCVDYYYAVMAYAAEGNDWPQGGESDVDAAMAGLAAVVVVMVAW